MQKVGFRAYVVGVAHELEITGWVCNRVDGTVEAHACGTPSQLEIFYKFLCQGPRLARVSAVKVEEVAEETLMAFTVRQTY